ncbi:uncharacterized protein LOC134223027 [Armigeres subalbatus]|uniref:uncharacterized protein LOC134223027 n=1 Tax=Armigeres subalbatus TaxID=124917 RepID=UPI002ED16B65
MMDSDEWDQNNKWEELQIIQKFGDLRYQESSMYQCKTCFRADSKDARMFTCDQCRQWEHFQCAGIDEAVHSRPFVCKKCISELPGNQRVLRSHTKGITITKSSEARVLSSQHGSKVPSMRSGSSRSSVVRERLKLAEEEAKIRQKEIEEEEQLHKSELAEAQRQLEEKKKLLEEESNLRQRTLEANRARLEKQQSIRRESLEKRNEILLQLSERGSIIESVADSVDKVSKWLTAHPSGRMTERKSAGVPCIPATTMVPLAPTEVPGAPSSGPTKQPQMKIAFASNSAQQATFVSAVAAEIQPSTTPTHSVNISSSPLPCGQNQTLFRIIPVVLYGIKKSVTIFAFIDEGSQITMLEEKVAKELGVTGPIRPLTLQWTGNVKRNERHSQEVCMQIAGKNSNKRFELRQARTVSCLVLPTQQLNYREISDRFPHLKGLPVEGYDYVRPKLLIGLDNLRLGVPLRLREGGPHDPIAAKCRLGWSIYGSTSTNPAATVAVNFHTAAVAKSEELLNEQLRDYFTLESCGVVAPTDKLESEEDKRARRIFEETTRRIETGFETGLLWKSDKPEFPDTYPMALRRMKSLEKKLQKDPTMMQRVQEQLSGFEQKGYIHKISDAEWATVDQRRAWFLPLGVVTTPKKPGKIRLIWDAAAKVEGVSFNSYLLKGPDLLTPLPRVLSGFRLFPVAISGDIREMFLQIKLQPADRHAQLFLFRSSPDEAVQTYAIDVTMFGSTCSPSSAQYVKNVNAEQFSEYYPRATVAIREHHYVDDYLDSFRTVNEAVQMVNDVKYVHSRGGFEIRNFLSNRAEVLRRTGEIEPEPSKDFALVRAEIIESVLGMRWLPEDDVFTYTLALRNDLQPILNEQHVPSKREVLKVVMSLFDPLGFVSFFLVHGKVLMQDVWASGIAWDEKIGEELFQRSIPASFERLELHVFVDASDSAYACVAYYRLETENGTRVALIGAKTKVAPLKVLSIPRLELKAAVLGVRILETTGTIADSATLTVKPSPMKCVSDSK